MPLARQTRLISPLDNNRIAFLLDGDSGGQNARQLAFGSFNGYF
jgi:hypothetical protein